MPVPDFQSVFLPFLQFAGDELEHSISDTVDALAKTFSLSRDELSQMLPSRRAFLFANRVAWVKTYFLKAGLIEPTRRAHFRITERGLKVLAEKPDKFNGRYLSRFPEYQSFRAIKREKSETDVEDDERRSPEEALEMAYKTIHDNLASDLLQQIKASPPSQFEKIVVELLLKMGYGGTRKDAGEAIGRSGDEGIDGII